MSAPPFSITAHLNPHGATLVLAGELDAFAACALAAHATALPRRVRRVQLDMRAVTFIDAGGVGTLVRLEQELAAKHASLVVVGACEYVRWVCTLAGVASILGVEPVARPRDGRPLDRGEHNATAL